LNNRPVRKALTIVGALLFMAYYVYILCSTVDRSYYKGFSEDPLTRLNQHNNGETTSTRHLAPWELVYTEEHASKTEALIREKNLKKYDRKRMEALVRSPRNCLHILLNKKVG
jgi:putative endonuclease